MPAYEDTKHSWAVDTADNDGVLPATSEVIENGMKIVTEYKYNDDDKKVKVVRTYKQKKEVVPRSVARRKTWAKFGDSAKDKAGPNSHTTLVGEEVNMQFISNKEEEKQADPLAELTKSNIAKCRICSGEHWSVNCPLKGTAMDSSKIMETMKPTEPTPSKPGRYVPPGLKDTKAGLGMLRGRDDGSAIRISNLSELMVEADLEELVKKFGPHTKMFLARDKMTGLCKGFAYVHFKFRRDAEKAIEALNGHGYDHLILSAEWSKPQNN